MRKSYSIPQKVWGTYGLATYEYEPGEVTPTGPAELEILEYLVQIGQAFPVVPPAKSKKTEV